MMGANIETAAARLRWAVWIVWGLLVAAYVAGRLGIAAGPVAIATKTHDAPALAMADASMLLLTMALFRLSQMLSALKAEAYFSAAVVRGLRSFAFWLFLLALLWVVTPFASELLGKLPGPAHQLTFRIAIRDVLTLGLTLILFLVARLLERAQEIEAEMREIV